MTDPLEVHAQTRKNERTLAAIAEAVDGNEGLIRSRARADLSRRLTTFLSGFLGILTVGLLIYLSLNINNAAIAIQDCTDPSGKCYHDSVTRNAQNLATITKAQDDAAMKGSEPSKRVLVQSLVNGQDIQVILGILDRQYPDAARAVRAQIAKEGKTP